jgi:hypothetical protein
VSVISIAVSNLNPARLLRKRGQAMLFQHDSDKPQHPEQRSLVAQGIYGVLIDQTKWRWEP